MNNQTPLYTAEQTRCLDATAINEHGIAGYELMQRAGWAVFDLIGREYAHLSQIAIVCGVGNNAGDGYVVARLARQNGMDVSVLQLGDASRLKGDALTAWQAMLDVGVEPDAFSESALEDAEIIVDAVFGTGLERKVEGDWAAAINAMNASSALLISVDIPSGLQADTGAILGCAVKADHTVTFIGRKLGLYTHQGPDYCGRVHFHDLGVPGVVYEKTLPVAHLLNWPMTPVLARRTRNAHKGMYGHVLVVGGDYGMAGAALMAGEAAARVGAGLTTVASRPEHTLSIAMKRPELMALATSSVDDLKARWQDFSVVALGPGLGSSDWGNELLLHVMTETNKPLVIDADGLNLLSQLSVKPRDNWILTPHPGEAARLLGLGSEQVQNNRIAAAKDIQKKYGGVVVLKGLGTVVTDGMQTCLCNVGNPGMASGGMGDVLTGIIAGLVAQQSNQSLFELACAGVMLHGHAADVLWEQGQKRLLATDLFSTLPSLASDV